VQDCANILYVDAILDGQKIELSGVAWLTHFQHSPQLLPGDYQARLLKDPYKVAGTPLYKEYEILLPDGTVWKSSVTGISE